MNKLDIQKIPVFTTISKKVNKVFIGTTQQIAEKFNVTYNVAAGLVAFLKATGKVTNKGVFKKEGQLRGKGQNIYSFEMPIVINEGVQP